MPTADQNGESPFLRRVFRVLLDLARQHKRQFVVIALYSFLYTAADLIQPLIYRRAINDVAGLFVAPGASLQVPARTLEQTLITLIFAVTLLFFISVGGYFFSLRARLHGARVASEMESSLIVRTFGHVLRLPLTFFSHRASAGLAKASINPIRWPPSWRRFRSRSLRKPCVWSGSAPSC